MHFCVLANFVVFFANLTKLAQLASQPPRPPASRWPVARLAHSATENGATSNGGLFPTENGAASCDRSSISTVNRHSNFVWECKWRSRKQTSGTSVQHRKQERERKGLSDSVATQGDEISVKREI